MQSSEDILLINVLKKELTVPFIRDDYREGIKNRLNGLLNPAPPPKTQSDLLS